MLMRPTREKIGIRKARDRFYGCVGKGKELVEARARERKKEAFAEANGELFTFLSRHLKTASCFRFDGGILGNKAAEDFPVILRSCF